MLLPTLILRAWYHPKWVMPVAFSTFFVLVLIKELWWDLEYESSDERRITYADILTYLCGEVIGAIASFAVWPNYPYQHLGVP